MSASDTSVLEPTDNLSCDASLDQFKSSSAQITEDTIKSIVQETAQSVTQSIEAEKPKKGFKKVFVAWFNDQVEKLGRMVMALALAALVAVLTPILVKLQMADEIHAITATLTQVINSTDSRQAIERNSQAQQQQLEIEQRNASTLDLLHSETLLQSEKLQEVVGVNEALVQQDVKLDELRAALDNITRQPSTDASRVLQDRNKRLFKLSQELNRYISSGQKLLEKTPEVRGLNSWVDEVYFFVSIIPSESGNFDEVRNIAKQIYTEEKPYDTQAKRVGKMLVVLRALDRWMKVSAS